jgi:hypothetical protein
MKVTQQDPSPLARDDELSLRVPRVPDLYSLGQETFASALTSSRKNGAATFCFHPRAKTVLALPRSFRRLISSFHSAMRRAGGTVEAEPGLSTRPGLLLARNL